MDPETLTALADSLIEHDASLDPEELGPYLDAACEALERAGGREIVVGFYATNRGWRLSAMPLSYDPPIEAPAELSRLVLIIAARCANAAPWDVCAGSHMAGEVVIDTRRRPRVTYRKWVRRHETYPLERAEDVIEQLNLTRFTKANLCYESDRDDGVRFTVGPRVTLELFRIAPELCDMILARIRETLDRETWLADAFSFDGFIQIYRQDHRPEVILRATVRGEVLVAID